MDIASVDAILDTAIRQVGYRLARTAIRAQFPFLNLPIISQIADFFLSRFADSLYQQAELIAAFKIIDARTEEQVKAFKAATAGVQNAAINGGPDEIKKAVENFQDTLARLVRIGRM